MPRKSLAKRANKGTKAKGSIQLQDLPRYDLEQLVTTDEKGKSVAKGGVALPFPWRLHECLDKCEVEGLQHLISWQPHGRSFTIYNPKKFAELVMPRFFGQTRYASFQRQLNIYGFVRFTQGRDKGAYHHLSFVRGHRSLVRDLKRIKVKGTGNVKRSKQEIIDLMMEEHDFYHPAWKGHFEGTVPLALQKNKNRAVPSEVSRTGDNVHSQERVVSPVNSSFVATPTAVSPPSSSLPSPQDPTQTVQLVPAAPVSSKAIGDASHCIGQGTDLLNELGSDELALSMTDEDEDLAIMEEFPPLLDINEEDVDLIQQLEPTPIIEAEHNKIHMTLVDAARNIYAC